MIQRKPASFESHPDTVIDTVGTEPDELSAAAAGANGAAAPPEPQDLPQPRELLLEEYFLGSLYADGVLFDRRGRVRRRFHVDMQGAWEAEWGTLQESFVFDDGERQQRTWRLHRLPPQRGVRCYEASADDVVGPAVGYAAGAELRWSYVLELALGARRVRVRMDDRMYLLDGGRLLNRTEMRKFGVRVASLLIVFGRN